MKFDETRETYSRIATLYYMGEQSQEEIASMFGISRFKVSRVLKRCRELKIIEFSINNKPHYYSKLENQIEQLLGVRKCIVVSSGSTETESKTNVGRTAAKYLADILKDNMTVGFDWGSTLQTMVEEFQPTKKHRGCLFMQISGSSASQSVLSAGYIDGHDIVKGLAEKAGADWSLFPAPYIVKDKEVRDILMKERAIESHIENFEKLDIVFLGVATSQPKYYLPFYKNYLTKDECDLLKKEDWMGEVLNCRLDMEGNVQRSLLTDRVFSMDLKTLKSIPESVVLAAGRDKTPPLISGARGGYFKTMIITEIVALSILEHFEDKASR